jgi:hypothetical protein
MSLRVRVLVCLSIVSASCGRVGYENLARPSDAGDASEVLVDASDGSTSVDGTIDASLPPPRVFADICRFTSGVIVKNGAVEDEVLGPPLGMALARHCQNGATFIEKSQDDPTVLVPATGRPLIGPTQLGVLIGGEYYGRAVGYLDSVDSPVAVSQSGNNYTATNRATGQVIRTWDLTQLHNAHDFVIVQVIREPTSGSFLVHECGHFLNGTRAGAYYLDTVLGPGLATDTRTFYVVEWTDQNGDQLPNAGDTFALVASG